MTWEVSVTVVGEDYGEVVLNGTAADLRRFVDLLSQHRSPEIRSLVSEIRSQFEAP